MSIARSILMRMFGRPKGLLGKLGGILMARMNYECATWVIDLLHVQPNDKVVQVGFGPGVGIQLLAGLASTGYVAGVDPSQEMVEQATERNAKTKKRADLRRGSAESLPFEDNMFDKALAINSMQVWTGRYGWVARDSACLKRWRQDCAWVYAIFWTAENRID